METKRILVIGGTGYIGSVIVAGLIEKNNQISVLSRKTNNLNKNNRANFICGNVLDKKFLLNNLKSFDIVIYLAAVIRSFNKAKYKENIIGLKNTLEAMKQNKIKKVLYFSTQNIYLKNRGGYSSSKEGAEELIKKSSLDYMIIRPNYVYGIDKNNDFYRLYKIIKAVKICPIIGDGKNIIQPIRKEDVAKITIDLMGKWKTKKEINVSGKNYTSINQVVDIIKACSKAKFIRIHIPLYFLKLFKWFIPFDIENYNEDRVAPKSSNIVYGRSDIKRDLKKIILLD